MAQVGEDTGIPKVAPNVDGTRVQATAEDFGSGIGTGLQQLGAGAEKATDYYGQVAADDATNNWHTKTNAILYGDPNDSESPGYFSLKGADAMREKPNVAKALKKATDEYRGTLFTAQSKAQFDNDTRRTQWMYDSQIGNHYDQQSTHWQVSTNENKLSIAEDSVARAPNDPDVLGLALTHAREAAVRIEQVKNGGTADVSAAITKADQSIRLKQLDALRVTDPQAALNLLLRDEGGMVLRSLPNYASLVHSVQEDAVNASTAHETEKAIEGWKDKAAMAVHVPVAPLAGGTGPMVEKVEAAYRPAVSAILGGESQHDENSGGDDGSFTHAGLGQFTVDQWKTTTGQTIAANDVGIVGRDPRLNGAQSVQAIAQLAKQNRDRYMKDFHREPTPGDLALMHQQGTGGGMKLLHAMVSTPNAPAKNFVSPDALTRNNVPAGATVAQAVRHIEDYYISKSGSAPNFNYKTAPGMVAAGNLDPWHRPVLHNDDGGYSTTSSISIGTEKGETVIPTVVDGKRLSEADAIAHFKKTGENFGSFKTIDEANKFATDLHNAQASMYDEHGNPVQQAATQQQYNTQSDYMLDHREEAVDNYRSTISNDPAFAGREDLVARATQSFENNYNRQIRDQNQQYLVDAHSLQTAVFQNRMASENDLMASSPENAAAWLRLQYENPQAAESMRNWFKANAVGQSKTYGTEFNTMLQRVMAPIGDPERIADPAQISAMVGAGENSILTNSGGSALLQILHARETPQGENDTTTMRGFLQQAHNLISPLSKKSLGQYWPQGEQKYSRFVNQALQLVAAKRQAGEPLAEILKKGGDVDTLLGQSIPTMAEQRKATSQVVHDSRMKPQVAAYNFLKNSKSPDDLNRGIKQGVISPAQARQASIMNATTVKELQDAYRAKLISWDDASMALEHLRKYNRNYYGKPVP